MSLIVLLEGAAIIAGAYFVVKFTLEWIKKRLKQYFSDEDVDAAVVAEICKAMDECTNRRSYELLKKAREKGYSYIMYKTENGTITGDVDFIKDKNSSLDPEVEELLGPDEMVIMER